MLETLDNGKPIVMAKTGDIPTAARMLRYYAGWADKLTGKALPNTGTPTFAYTRKEAVGVCAQIIPWNFPFLMAVAKIAPVLTAGCTTVLKPAE